MDCPDLWRRLITAKIILLNVAVEHRLIRGSIHSSIVSTNLKIFLAKNCCKIYLVKTIITDQNKSSSANWTFCFLIQVRI